MERNVLYSKLPWGIWLIEKLNLCYFSPSKSYKALVFLLTFCCYTTYHLSRKPFSVVKIALCPVCANCIVENDTETPGWPPFNDEHHGKTLLGVLDYSWLFTYAIALYLSGFVADRMNLRIFLTIGMLGSGISVCLLGVAYFADIHKLYYFILVQIFGGLMQSTGWPGVLAVMTHWFGKHNRGLIMGIWNSHTSVGNILGTIIPSFWVDCEGDVAPWGWSFLVPGLISVTCGYLIFLFLVTDPSHVGLPAPVQHLEEDLKGLGNLASPIDAANSDRNQRSETGNGPSETGSEPSETGMEQNLLAPNTSDVLLVEKPKPINFFRALLIPGVVEYSLALFFNKLVSYTFLFWLPLYIKSTRSGLSGAEAGWLATLFDVGGIIGGIVAGVVSDLLNARAITCFTMLLLAVPMLFVLRAVEVNLGVFIVFLIINGALINGPYSMITTAVSIDLGTHPSLKASTNAKATVTAIIDGTGSLGAAVGPLLVGLISDYSSWTNVFYFLMACCLVAAVLLSRLVVREAGSLYSRLKHYYTTRGLGELVELQRLRPRSDDEEPTQSGSD